MGAASCMGVSSSLAICLRPRASPLLHPLVTRYSALVTSSEECERDAEQPGHHADHPEAHRDLRLRPTEQLEMVVERRHLEDALAVGQLEVTDLQDDREGLRHEDEADDRQQQPL